MARRRLDSELVDRGIVQDIETARTVIAEKKVIVNGSSAVVPGTMVSRTEPISISSEKRFASRGGDKLDGALQDLGLDVYGLSCLDAGAGSGGFTDVLLSRGASSVIAVDVGYGQFDWRLRNDPRVKLLERTNIRSIGEQQTRCDIVVADLSFMSLATVSDHLFKLCRLYAVALIKPQFEAADGEVPIGGVVIDPGVWREALSRVASAFSDAGGAVDGVVASRIKGAAGNQEFFMKIAHLDASDESNSLIPGGSARTIDLMIDSAIAKVKR
ncbi:MAG: TlyA family RNA methyltransferase [Actinomycetota bacterium]|nr:TlyA family RNA methyltransferase [Actinomycetota bacterium]